MYKHEALAPNKRVDGARALNAAARGCHINMETLEQPQPVEATTANVITIATHDGVFHADDVFAVATVLMCVGPRFDPFTEAEKVRIVRTRDRRVLGAADIVIDVGGLHDPDTQRYDHHQGAGERENGIPYAAFGLVWERFGYTACRNALFGAGSEHLGGEVAQVVASTLAQALDAHDTGHTKAGAAGIPAAISAFNPRWDEEQTEEHFARKFDDAVSFAQGVLARAIRSAASDFAARAEIDAAIASCDGEVLVLERYVPWQERVTRSDAAGHIKFVVYPAVDGSWRCQTVQVRLGEFRPVRCNLPTEWWGKDDSALDEIAGIPGCVFCHINGFVVGHRTKAGAVTLAELALSYDRSPGGMCRSV